MRLDEVQKALGRLVTTLDIRASRRLIDQAPPETAPHLRAVYAHLGPLLIEHYQDLIRGAWWGTLDKCYSITANILGKDWRTLCEDYLQACPPNDWDINSLTLQLPEYLKETWLKAHLEHPLYLAELAEYERIELEVFLCEDEAPASDSRPVHRRCPKVNGSLQVQRFSWDIATWVKNLEDDALEEKPSAPESIETLTAFYRHPEALTCRFLNVDPATAYAIQCWEEGKNSEEIAGLFETLSKADKAASLKQLDALAADLRDAGLLIY